MIPTVALLGCLLLIPPQDAEPIELRIEGTSGLSSVRLGQEIRPWIEDLLAAPDDVGMRDDLLFEVVSIYRRYGFPDATASIAEEMPTEEGAEGRTLVVIITEGPRAYLRGVSIRGNVAIDNAVLQGAFPWLRAGIVPGSSQVFTKGALASGVAGIKLLYSLNGYLDVSVETRVDREEVLRGDSPGTGPGDVPVKEYRVEVVVQVTEGPRTILESLDVTPGETYSVEEIRALTGVSEGSPVTPRLPIEVRNRVRRQLLDRGHYLARVEVEESPVPGRPDRRALAVRVVEGPVHTFGSVIVDGERHTRRGFIRARLGIDFGDTYSKTMMEEGQRELSASGLFQNFDLELVPWPPDPTRLNVHVTVVERDAIRFETRVGFSTYELGRIGAGVLHRNLFGLGIEGRADALVSFRGEESEARLRYPYLNDDGLTLLLRGKYRRFEEVSFDRQEVLGTVALEQPIDRMLTLSTGYEWRDEQVSNVDVVNVDEIAESSTASLVFLGARHDSRDSAIDPTEGLILTSRIEYSSKLLGAELEFGRITVRAAHTTTYGDDWRFVLAAQSGVIDRLDRGEVPLGERFFLGGSRTVRSFRQDRMPPFDQNDNAIGGESFLAATVEVRRRMWGSFEGATFLDAGSLSTDLKDYAGKNWRFASGLGLIWNSPVGPLRADWGITLNPQPGEDHWAIHILLGHPF